MSLNGGINYPTIYISNYVIQMKQVVNILKPTKYYTGDICRIFVGFPDENVAKFINLKIVKNEEGYFLINKKYKYSLEYLLENTSNLMVVGNVYDSPILESKLHEEKIIPLK